MRNLFLALLLITRFAYSQNNFPVKLFVDAHLINGYTLNTANIRTSIFSVNPDTTIKYTELHNVRIGHNRYITLNIGNGVSSYGEFDTISFDKSKHGIRFEIDWSNSGTFEYLNSIMINTVPYALHASNTKSKGIIGLNGDTGLYVKNIRIQNDTIIINLNNHSNKLFGPIKKSKGVNGESIDTMYAVLDTLFIKTTDKLIGYANIQGEKGNKGANAKLGKYKHYIGERYGGGVVFYVYHDSTGEHGLIVSDINLSVNAIWSNYSLSVMPDSCQTCWDGRKATDCIISQVGHAISAALICDTSNHNGYSDWYLPSVGEFYLLIKNYFEVESTLIKFGLTPLNLDNLNVSYWTSTELTRERAIRQNMLNVGVNSLKTVPMRVRAIRKF